MTVGEEGIAAWTESQFNKLQFELKKLMPPFPTMATEQVFDVIVRVFEIPGVPNVDERVKPFPVVDLFDYRISGSHRGRRKRNLWCIRSRSRGNSVDEEISLDLGKPSGCGKTRVGHSSVRPGSVVRGPN